MQRNELVSAMHVVLPGLARPRGAERISRAPRRGKARGAELRDKAAAAPQSLEAGARKSPNVPNYVKHYNHGYSTVIKTRKRHFTGALYPGSGDRPRRGFFKQSEIGGYSPTCPPD